MVAKLPSFRHLTIPIPNGNIHVDIFPASRASTESPQGVFHFVTTVLGFGAKTIFDGDEDINESVENPVKIGFGPGKIANSDASEIPSGDRHRRP